MSDFGRSSATAGPEAGDGRTNYLIFSDVHLGADLVQHVRPWTTSQLKQVARIDRELSAMLHYYSTHRDPERPWRLIVAGDLVDFIGMSIAPPDDGSLSTALNDEERRHGLGSARDHAGWKMRAVARRHELVFRQLALFVAAGHSLVLVRGNHDVDFHWTEARQAFVDSLAEHVPELRGNAAARRAFEERIEFYPWFYYVEDLLYVEHGHQFDAMCRYQHLLAPVQPEDPGRIQWSFSDLLLRSVVRPTRGLSADGHEDKGIAHYVRLGLSLGMRGGLDLFVRYVSVIARGIRDGRSHLSDAARAIREEHERGMNELATRTRVRLEQMKELAAMWPRPVTRGPLTVLRSMFLDRIVIGLSAVVLSAIGFALFPLVVAAPTAFALFLTTVTYALATRGLRASDIDPTDGMRKAASRIAELLPTRYVVMGHTHRPVFERIGDGVTYVNVGNWGADEDAPAAAISRTHLVLRFIDGEFRGELKKWDEAGIEPRAGSFVPGG